MFQEYIDEIDDIHTRFKMNARECEAELFKIKDLVKDEFRNGMLDPDKYKVLDDRIDEYLHEIHKEIMNPYDDLLEEKKHLENRIEEIKKTLRNPENRDIKIKEMQKIQNTLQKINNYLSSAFGRFAPERFGQEVSWAWLDIAVLSGVGDFMGVFLRLYNEYTPNASTFYVNL